MDFHSILRRQVRKIGLEDNCPPADAKTWLAFLESVNAAYVQSDQDRYTLERSIEISSREMQSLNADLMQTNETIKDNQSQLVQSEKMASLGQLAAGVAHEINNPMGFLISNLERLSEYLEVAKRIWALNEEMEKAVTAGDVPAAQNTLSRLEDLKRREDFPFIRKDLPNLLIESIEGAYRVKEIVQNLKSFARVDESEYKEADLNEGLESTLKIIGNELKQKCRVIKDFSPLPLILCYPRQLNQVFLNLLINAAQSISGQGEIRIITGVQGSNIVIRIADTGSGIPPEVLPKLFTPFFTTKGVGKGTGLGLSISYGIINKHAGAIAVESEVGKGATFILTLPLSGVPL